jgi:hypothetical protein
MTFCNMHLSNYMEYQDLFQDFISILRQLHCNKRQHIYNNIISEQIHKEKPHQIEHKNNFKIHLTQISSRNHD